MPITFPHLRSIEREPVAVAEAGRGVLISVIAAGSAFGWWHLNDEQLAALLTMYVAVSGMLAMFARAKSTPTASVALTHDQVSVLEKATPPPGPVPIPAAEPKKRPARKPAPRKTPVTPEGDK